MKVTNIRKICIMTTFTLFMSFLPSDFQRVYSYDDENLNEGNELVVDTYEDITTSLDENQVVDIPDTNLAREIKKELNKNEGDVVTVGDMERLTNLYAQDNGINDLTGLEYAVNMDSLNIIRNSVKDITPLKNMKKLKYLGLEYNNIQNIEVLKDLTEIQVLYLRDNEIRDISPLSNLSYLETVCLQNNYIESIEALTNIANLKHVYLSNNNIEDISPLKDKKTIETLLLGSNKVKDISDLSTLTNLQWLDIKNNEINNITSLSGLVKLTELELSNNIIVDVSPLSELKSLLNLRVDYNKIEDVAPISRLVNLQLFSVTNNRILDFRPLQGFKTNNLWCYNQNIILKPVNVKDKTTLTIELPRIYDRLGNEVAIKYVNFNDGVYEYEIAHTNNVIEIPIDTNQSRQGSLMAYFDDGKSHLNGTITQDVIIESELDGVSIVPDKNLEKAIKRALGLGEEIPLTEKYMERLEYLYVPQLDIGSIEGLQYAKNLRQLEIHDNKVKDLTPIKGLNKLEELTASRNDIEDILPLANLNNLKRITIDENLIEDITPLSNLNQLTYLSMWSNKAKSLEPLLELVNLKNLYIGENEILDLSPLSSMNLNSIDAWGQKVNLPVIEVEDGISFTYIIPEIKDIDGSKGIVQWVTFNDGISEHFYRVYDNKVEMTASTSESTKGKISFDFRFMDNLTGTNFGGSVNQEIIITSSEEIKVVDIPDKNLDEAIRNSLDLDDGVPLTTRSLKNLSSVYLSDSIEKVNLSGLEHATNLEEVSIQCKEIENSNILNTLPNLKRLMLYAGDKIDFSKGFIRLNELYIQNNEDLDESKLNLRNLKQIERISVTGCSIEDVNFIEGLSTLLVLNISGNSIKDISVIESLSNLMGLDISNNMVCDFSPISKMVKLTQLYLNNTAIKDFSILDNLDNLKILEVMGSNIEDISTLSNVDRFVRLDLSNNKIRDLTPLGEKPKGRVKVLDQRIELDEIEINIGDTFTYNAPPILDNKGVNINRNGTVELRDEKGNYVSQYIVNRGKGIIENLPNHGSAFQYISSKYPDTIEYSYRVTQNLVGIKGDFDKNGVVDALDLAMIASKYNIDSSQEQWQEKFDMIKDGIIDIYDLVSVSSKFE